MVRGVQEDQGQPGGMDGAALHNMQLSRPGRPASQPGIHSKHLLLQQSKRGLQPGTWWVGLANGGLAIQDV